LIHRKKSIIFYLNCILKQEIKSDRSLLLTG
jgi:hypothetical protein